MSRLFIFIVVMSITTLVVAEDAKTVLKKVDDVIFTVKDKTADVKMVMTNLKTNSIKTKKAEFYQKGMDKKLFRYTYPESDKGIATLTTPDAVYLYLPMFKKAKRVTNLAEGNAFNKSDFSLEDMPVKTYSELFVPTMVSEDNDKYILKLVPKGESSYGYQIATIDKKSYLITKMEYYDKKGEKGKEAVYSYSKIAGYQVAESVTMTNIKKSHKTEFIMTNIHINTGLQDSLFTVENMSVKK